MVRELTGFLPERRTMTIDEIMEHIQKDHDLLVRLDEKMNNVLATINNFANTNGIMEARLRQTEEDIKTVLPLKDIVTQLAQQNTNFLSGWKLLCIVGGSVLGILSFITYVLNLFVFHFNGK